MGLITPEQLLAEHSSELYPAVYFIRRLANFRAQMKRAVMLVRSAAKKRIFQERSTLLIIGGGVSGLAAGLEAAKHNMVVTLLESEKELLSAQSRCDTRFLHPYEYNWPLAHYRENAFPALEKDKRICPDQMHWKAGVASEIVRKMRDQIRRRAPSNLDLRLGVKHIPVSLRTLRDDFDRDEEFEFILICAGAKERAKLDDFKGFEYWESDPLEDLDVLKKKRKGAQNVLISGGGDGGLQDLLRVTTSHPKNRPFSAGKLLNQLLPILRRSPEFVEWLDGKQKDCLSFRPDPEEMCKEFDGLLDVMERDVVTWEALSRAVEKKIDPAVWDGRRRVRLAFTRAHFSKSFALNAFLVKAVCRVMKEFQWLDEKCEVEKILSVQKSHRCRGKAKVCCGKPHRVFFKTLGVRVRQPEEFDVIVLRHGSDQAIADAAKRAPRARPRKR